MQVTSNQRRLLQSLAYVVGGGFLLAAFLWLGFSENKSAALLLGLAAVVSARILYVSLPEYLERAADADNSDSDSPMIDTSENPPQERPPTDRSDST